MERDEQAIWEEAWVVRDPAYDGRFFVAVRTTGVYCRCICPVRPPFRRNVSFLPSAAAAEDAAYRPCLRCRPETAPFCPAWKGTLTTAERAARLITEGALDGEGASVELLPGGWASRAAIWVASCSAISAPAPPPWRGLRGCSGPSGC